MKYLLWFYLAVFFPLLPGYAQLTPEEDLTQFTDSSSIVTPPYGVFEWDKTISRQINNLELPVLIDASSALSNSLLPVGIGLPAAMVFASNTGVSHDAQYNRYLAETGVLTFTAEASAILITVGLKALVARERPYVASPKEFVGRADELLSSFPSGHAAGSAALATMLSLRYPQWYVILPSALWSLGVSFSRVHLGVHYFSDVVVGTIVGGGIAVAVHALRNHILPSYEFLLPPEAQTSSQQINIVQLTQGVGVALQRDGAAVTFAVPVGR